MLYVVGGGGGWLVEWVGGENEFSFKNFNLQICIKKTICSLLLNSVIIIIIILLIIFIIIVYFF
jgi:hypothetical protein